MHLLHLRSLYAFTLFPCLSPCSEQTRENVVGSMNGCSVATWEVNTKCPLITQSGHSPKLGYASGTFGVRYYETLDFFRITGALRCKANNFFGYDFN